VLPDTLNEAVIEAERFIHRVKELRTAKAKAKSLYSYHMNPKECGAVRRSSMDLTRKLAQLRAGK
jgi:hypothetical protein